MAWRGTSSLSDRFFATLPYLLPLIDVIVSGFGKFLFAQVPGLALLFAPLAPLIMVYSGVPFVGLLVFFALYLLVIRNENISHFIRFNTMQAILIDIVLILCNVVNVYLIGPTLGQIGSSANFLIEVLFNVVFLGTLAAVGYSVVQVVRGVYPDKIPSLSDIVHMQIR
ncbi:MAG: hypothetical protein HC857_14825 [Synechococcales cyanobacterium RU_4_20]|nr:hypothetical protein [Synechococcales cyanobacterium RU_4_20]NJR68892.1 hypothetical protein [Synechococcales cyanobacterium CRU_2_2]